MNYFEKELNKNCPVSFHMPGHKNNLRKIKFLNRKIGKYDTTETHNHDNLHNPKTIIKELQEKIQKEYRSFASYPLINGSTSGILTALSYLPSNSKVLIDRDSHMSVYNGCEINNLTFEYLPDDLSALSNMLKNKYSALIVTSPSYYGVCKDLKSLHEVCKENNTLLIVDYAHGAHLHKQRIDDRFLQHHSDVSITSLHKTLPALTSAAILNIYNKSIDLNKIEKYLKTYQTSSPSYLVLASIASCIEFMSRKNIYEKLLIYIKKACSKSNGLEYLNIDETDDPTRLIISTKGCNIAGYELFDSLIKSGIECEMPDETSVVLISTPLNKARDFSLLVKSLRKIDSKLSKNADVVVDDIFIHKSKPFNIGRNKDIPYVLVSLDDAVGKVSKGFISLYPPFKPILLPGEVISQDVLKLLIKYKDRLISDYSDIKKDLIAVLNF